MKDYFPGNLGGNDRRFNRSHRNDSPLTRDMNGNQRRNGYHRKKSGPDQNNDAFTEMMSSIKDQLRRISDNQTRMADLHERTAAAEERKADALENLAEHLKQLLGPSIAAVIDQTMETPADIDDVTVNAGNGDGVLKTIVDMREQGLTFGKIADHLIDEDIPPFAGIKQWNRLSVSKVYKDAAL